MKNSFAKHDMISAEGCYSTTAASTDENDYSDSISTQSDTPLDGFSIALEEQYDIEERKSFSVDLNEKRKLDKTFNRSDFNGEHQLVKFDLETTPMNETIHIFGCNISHFSRSAQFVILSSNLFIFAISCGLIQELLIVRMADRKLAFFISMCQFSGYSLWSYLLSIFHARKKKTFKNRKVPLYVYLCLSILRAIDVSMSNLSMRYLNYPTKTIIKSSRVAFTMWTGLLTGRRYKLSDYFVAVIIVTGLIIFLHADSNAAVFHPLGIFMLGISLMCDGVVNNWSEESMKYYDLGHDEFLFNLYSISLIFTVIAAFFSGDLKLGFTFLLQPGTFEEIKDNSTTFSFSPSSKRAAVILMMTTGYFGSSCAFGLTKHFGAFVSSITVTTRKSLTVIFSFFVYHNVCSVEHIVGVIIFLSGLVIKIINGHDNSRKIAGKIFNRCRIKWDKVEKDDEKYALICK